jgi:CarD family transcriptional regulator
MSELNLHIGDCIHYGGHGVCRICGRETKTLGKECRDYFLLRPVGDEKTTLYLPVDAQPDRVKLRNVLSASEIYRLVAQEQQNPPSWISDCRERRQICGQTLRSGDAGALIHLVRNMYAHEQQMPSGKLLPLSDQELLQSAENQLYNEFQFVLDIDRDQVLPFILGECRITEKSDPSA